MRKKVGTSVFKVCLSFVLAVLLCPTLSFAEDLPGNVEPDPEDTSNGTDIAELGNALDAPSAEDPSGEASDPGDVDVPFPGGAEAGAADGSGEGAEAAGPFGQPDTDVDPGAPEPPREAPLADGSYVVVPACSASRCLDVAGGSSADGADVRLWASNMTGAQRVVAKADPETGLYELTFVGTGKALDVSGAGTAAGTNVQQWSSYGNAAQIWSVEYAGGGAYKLVNAGAGKPLDVAGAGGWDGANVAVWSDNGTLAQRFRLVPTTYTPQTGAYQRSDGSWDWYNSEGDWDRDGAINRIMSTANSLLGVPYVWLGVYPQDGGMDCASFTWYLYRQLGIDIGFETYDQMYSGVPVWSLSDAKPGDLVLMYDNGWPNYVPGLFEYVVLYAGNGMIYEEPTFGGQCQYVSIWSKGMGNIRIRRILAD